MFCCRRKYSLTNFEAASRDTYIRYTCTVISVELERHLAEFVLRFTETIYIYTPSNPNRKPCDGTFVEFGHKSYSTHATRENDEKTT